MLSLLFMALNFNNDAVLVVSLYLNEVPIAVCSLIPFQFLNKQNGLLASEMNAFLFQPSANDACCKAVENKTCGETKYKLCIPRIDGYFPTVSLHKNSNGVTLGTFHFHQVANDALLHEL